MIIAKLKTTVALFFFFAFFVTSNAYAACDSIRCHSKIKRIYPTARSDGAIYIEPEEPNISSLNCTPVEENMLILNHSHPNFEEIFTLASMALALNKTVTLRIDGNVAQCSLGYLIIYNSQ